MNEKTPLFLLICVMVAFMTLLVVSIVNTPRELPYDYERTVLVDSSEKIEKAIKSAYDDVSGREFTIIQIKTMKEGDKRYRITCCGIVPQKLLETK